MHNADKFTSRSLNWAIAVALGCNIGSVDAQERTARSADTAQKAGSERRLEEVVVTGRLYDSAQALVEERMNEEVVTNILGQEAFSRTGDSDVAAALQRVSGLTLVNDKFVYVRGLGERYSSTTLNGARIPSPDLTRSVVPLSIFPTSIIESLRVQKSYSVDKSAEFGGGNVDMRTLSIPTGFTYSLTVETGLNTENDGDYLSYDGGDDDVFGTDDGTRALSDELGSQITNFQGDIGTQSLLNKLRRRGRPNATFADAQQLNRQLATELYRRISVEEEDVGPDYDVKGSLGHSVALTDRLEIGFLAGGAYENDVRETTKINRSFRFPQERTDTELEATRSVNITGTVNAGANFADEQTIKYTGLFLRNTDDETGVSEFFNENRQTSDGRGFRETRLKFEERELGVHQVTGTHRLGHETLDLLPFGLDEYLDWVPQDAEFSWFSSNAESETNIPNEVSVISQTQTDPDTGEVLSSRVQRTSAAATYTFTNLDDQVDNWGWSLMMPLRFGASEVELSVGGERTRQARLFVEENFSLGALSAAEPTRLEGSLGRVFSDDHILDPANNFVFDTIGTDNQSYIAATMTDAVFGKFDWTWRDTWRLSAGLRWEDYRQVALDVNAFGFSVDDPIVSTDAAELARNAFRKDDIFPGVSLTYMSSFLAEDFQLRFGWSETVVRPDLREIVDATYIDPLTDDLVEGNPSVRPAELTNYDVRGEWFFSNGDNATVSFYYKKLTDPIEFFETAASDTTIAREVINAESAEIYGSEIEVLKNLGFLAPWLGTWMNAVFLQGNFTIQNTELVAGPQADAPTHPTRQLTNASDYMVNTVLGYDASNGRHSATLAYNVFGERLFVAGRNGAPDGFEQPFHSLDATYSWYPTDSLTLKAEARNMLDDEIEIERQGLTTFEEEIGRTFALSLEWAR